VVRGSAPRGSDDLSNFEDIALRYDDAVRWLIDGYNVIRRSPELSSKERESLEAGRRALCVLLSRAAHARGDQFTVVFDGSGGGGSAAGAGVRVIFSSARETADKVLARMAAQGGAVVSSDREVRRAATRAGAIAVAAEEFLGRLEALPRSFATDADEAGDSVDKDALEERRRGSKKGNPRRLGKKARAAARALGRLGPRSPR
jgi:predicted RNA-binding protein with PIN domain